MNYSLSLKARIIHHSPEILTLKPLEVAGSIKFPQPSAALSLLITEVSDASSIEYAALIDRIQSSNVNFQITDALYWLDTLTYAGLLDYHLFDKKTELLFLEPMAPGLRIMEHQLNSVLKWQLSRFCYFRLHHHRMLCESPRGFCRVWLHPEVTTQLFSLLVKPISLAELKTQYPQWPEETIETLIILLSAAGILVDAEDSLETSFWEFHDLLFHCRSRVGRHDYPSGGTYRYKNKKPSPPAHKAPMSNEFIALKIPDVDTFSQDPPFQHVLENRRSIREHGTQPITIEQLSEFLYRALRKKNHQENRPDDVYPSRNYPSGGALYELEAYLLISRCKGLERGLYHYRAQDHVLEKVCPDNPLMQSMLAIATRVTNQTENHDILLTLTARFERLAWKYETIAYATILKHVGVVLQTLYMVATVMELAPCGVGSGNSTLFSKLSGLNFYEESAVGEFVLNSMPDKE